MGSLAAPTERDGLVVLADDKDYRTVAQTTGQPIRMVMDLPRS
ncbi:hypothetical protein [Nocardia vaccinii]|nr:hypothetical protein [Nocardia vaccinii]